MRRGGAPNPRLANDQGIAPQPKERDKSGARLPPHVLSSARRGAGFVAPHEVVRLQSATMLNCVKCGVPSAVGQRFCGNCGTALDAGLDVGKLIDERLAARLKDQKLVELETAQAVIARIDPRTANAHAPVGADDVGAAPALIW
jgi:hypothetical protein